LGDGVGITALDSGTIHIHAFNNGSFKSIFSGLVYAGSLSMVAGIRDTAEVNNALRFTTTGGVNITGGSILLYGSK
jgi:hypothetical protein